MQADLKKNQKEITEMKTVVTEINNKKKNKTLRYGLNC